jgi:hypothetical protein
MCAFYVERCVLSSILHCKWRYVCGKYIAVVQQHSVPLPTSLAFPQVIKVLWHYYINRYAACDVTDMLQATIPVPLFLLHFAFVM